MNKGKKIVRPPYLKEGDKVALVSPAYWVPQEAMWQAAEMIKGWGHAEGILVGGNLSSYSAIAGTRYQLPPKQDVILFIEEEEEALHNIDRLFYHLRLQMNFERVKGIIFGSFNAIRYDLQFGSVEQMLTAHLADLDIPICCGFPIGSNSCIPMIEGAPCTLDVTTEKSVLTFNIDGDTQPYCLINDSQQLFR